VPSPGEVLERLLFQLTRGGRRVPILRRFRTNSQKSTVRFGSPQQEKKLPSVPSRSFHPQKRAGADLKDQENPLPKTPWGWGEVEKHGGPFVEGATTRLTFKRQR